MPRRYSRKVTRRLSKLRGDQRAMRDELLRLKEELAARQTRQRQVLILLVGGLLVVAIGFAVSVLLVNHPRLHRTRWALPGALYALAIFILLVGVALIWRSDRASRRVRVAVAVSAAATLALSAGLTLESELILRTGPRGTRGQRGHEGGRGGRGPEGERGRRGREGRRGPRGQTGERGPQGERGPPGYFYGGS
jgi:hypothetical protein